MHSDDRYSAHVEESQPRLEWFVTMMSHSSGRISVLTIEMLGFLCERLELCVCAYLFFTNADCLFDLRISAGLEFMEWLDGFRNGYEVIIDF